MPLFMMAPFWEEVGVRGGETDRQRRRQGDSDGETEIRTDRERERQMDGERYRE